jgi:FAD/FMN-containing dehydrogenase
MTVDATIGAPARSRFRNWLGNQRCDASIIGPRSLGELADVVAAAALRGPVRPVGMGTAWSPLALTTGTLIDTRGLDRILDIDPFGPVPSVRVEAGITVRRLSTALAAVGWALVGPTMFRDVSVGGAAATGSHGFGAEAGAFSDGILSLTLVDALGEVHEIDARHPDTLAAARTSLGLLGVVYAVRLRMQPSFSVWVDEHDFPFGDVVSGIADILATYEFVQMFWFPQSPLVSVRGMRRLPHAPRPRSSLERARALIEGRVLHGAGYTVTPLVARLTPRLVPRLMRSAAWLNCRGRGWESDASHEFHYREAVPPCWSMAFAVPSSATAEALLAAREVAERRRRLHGDGPTFPFYARFVGPSSALLSGAYGEPTCFLESVLCRGSRDVTGYYRDYAATMGAIPGARPHWAKLLASPEGLGKRFPAAQAFLRVRERFDPNRVFMNRFLARALLDDSSA